MPHADPNVRREYMRKYRKDNRERLNKLNREWRRKKLEEDPEFRIREREYGRNWSKRNPEKVRMKNAEGRVKYNRVIRNSSLKSLYGITVEDYDRMVKNQGGLCAICGGSDPGGRKRYLCVDHNHRSGEVRALLCDPCNNGLGRFKDDPELIRKALLYLEKYDG